MTRLRARRLVPNERTNTAADTSKNRTTERISAGSEELQVNVRERIIRIMKTTSQIPEKGQKKVV